MINRPTATRIQKETVKDGLTTLRMFAMMER
jgi:hypothetical protein